MTTMPAGGDTVERVKLSERARDIIREKIVFGDFAFGEALRESALSALLDISKSPIREALVRLEHEGLVEMSANHSARVFTLTRDDLVKLGDLRALLETQALRRCMARDGGRDLGAALERLVGDGEAAAETGDDRAYTRIDDRFHRAFFEHCGNPYLGQSYDLLAARIQSMRSRLARKPGLVQRSLADHVAICQAVGAGETERAADHLSAHIQSNTLACIDWIAAQEAGRAAPRTRRVAIAEMERFARAALAAAGADAETVEAVVAALSHASRHGVDTHGYRLLPHYLEGFAKGRLNPRPALRWIREGGAVAVLEAGDAHGARASYAAADRAVAMARENGIGAVAIRGSSHFGAAGSYAAAIAEAGMAGLCVCNSDPFVRLHGGAEPVHGTNPIAFAAPAEDGAPPWLLDMATSAIPFNRVQLLRALGGELPQAAASDARGVDTRDPEAAAMLAPLGGAFGYKGAGLAGIAEILSAALSDAPLSQEIAPMISDDMATPRRTGAFVLAIDPAAFMGCAAFGAVVERYRGRLRGSAVAPGATVMSAGDREWDEARRRETAGIVLDATVIEAFETVASTYDLAPLRHRPLPD